MPHPRFHCPACGHELPDGTRELRCPSCGEAYRVHNGIPELIAQRFLDAFKQTERHFHDELSESTRTGSIAGRTAAFHRHFKRPMLRLPDGAAVLEVACGTRVDGIEIALAGKDVTSLDLSLDAVEHGRHLAKTSGAGDHLRFVVADGEHLPFANHSFDAAFVAASFHHFPNQQTALHEMARVTKPGGYVIWGVEPAAWPYRTLYRLLAPVKRSIRKRRGRRHDSIADDTTEGYTEEQIRSLFAAAGLLVREVRPVKLLSEFYDSGVRLAGRLLRKDLRSWQLLDHGLAYADAALGKIPGLRKLLWHWNVISTVPRRQ